VSDDRTPAGQARAGDRHRHRSRSPRRRFHAAEQSQDRGCRWGDVLDYATDAAVKVVDLLPDTVFDVVKQAN
jgi:hypothetical protein